MTAIGDRRARLMLAYVPDPARCNVPPRPSASRRPASLAGAAETAAGSPRPARRKGRVTVGVDHEIAGQLTGEAADVDAGPAPGARQLTHRPG